MVKYGQREISLKIKFTSNKHKNSIFKSTEIYYMWQIYYGYLSIILNNLILCDIKWLEPIYALRFIKRQLSLTSLNIENNTYNLFLLIK